MTYVLNQGVNSLTTQDWLKASEDMRLTAYDPSPKVENQVEVFEPGEAINLPAIDRERMNQAKPGL